MPKSSQDPSGDDSPAKTPPLIPRLADRIGFAAFCDAQLDDLRKQMQRPTVHPTRKLVLKTRIDLLLQVRYVACGSIRTTPPIP